MVVIPTNRGQVNKEKLFFLSPFAPRNFVSRDEFGRRVPNQPAPSSHFLHTHIDSTTSCTTTAIAPPVSCHVRNLAPPLKVKVPRYVLLAPFFPTPIIVLPPIVLYLYLKCLLYRRLTPDISCIYMSHYMPILILVKWVWGERGALKLFHGET